MSTSPPITDPISLLQSTLGSSYRVRIADGRLFTGSFVALDRQGNLVLDQGIEYAPIAASAAGDNDAFAEGRDVGLVLLPMKEWVSVEREVVVDEEGEGERKTGEEDGCVPH